MPCPKPQPCLRWASHIHYRAITEAEDLQGSSQGNPVVWRSWCHTHPWAPKSCNSNCPPSSRAEESQGRIRTWQTIVWFLWPSSCCYVFWHFFPLERQGPHTQGEAARGVTQIPILASPSQRADCQQNKKPPTGTGPHRSRHWAPGMPLWDHQGETVWGGIYLLTPKVQTCHPQAFLSCLPHLSPISLNPLSLFSTQDYFWLSYQPPPDW